MENGSVNYKTKDLRVVAEILQQEVYRRTLVRWKSNVPDCAFNVSLVLTSTISYNEEYTIKKKSENKYEISGKTIRALLYGVGKFLRCLSMDYEADYNTTYKANLGFRTSIDVLTSKPNYALRGHLISYNPKSNSYDATSLDAMKQEIVDHVLFGCNTIEMIPPSVDFTVGSPHFTQSWLDRMAAISEWCDKLDVSVSLWCPVYVKADWNGIFRAMKRIDHICVDSHCGAADLYVNELFSLVNKESLIVKKHFPNAKVWVNSEMGYGCQPGDEAYDLRARMDEFYEAVRNNKENISGVVYGAWTWDTIHEFRKNIPEELPVRLNPNLGHNMKTSYAVGACWDVNFALAYGRKCINPRPRFFTEIFNDAVQTCRYGAVCHSQGCADDVNKHVWAGLLWGAIDISEVIKDYATWYIGHEDAADVIFALEENWQHPLKSGHVMKTLEKTIKLHEKLPVRVEQNWRWQKICFRAYLDAFLYMRQYGDKGNDSLRWPMVRAGDDVTKDAKQKAEEVDYFNPSEMALYGRLEASAGILHALAGMQLDITRYRAMTTNRGGHLQLLESLPPDDGIKKGPFTVRRLPRFGGVEYVNSGMIVDYADTANADVRRAIAYMPTRYLSFYCVIQPKALPLEIDLENPNNSTRLEIVYIGRDLLQEGAKPGELPPRGVLPTRCLMNGDILHDYRQVTKTTRPHRFSIQPNMTTIHLQWDVQQRDEVTYALIPLPVADVRMCP